MDARERVAQTARARSAAEAALGQPRCREVLRVARFVAACALFVAVAGAPPRSGAAHAGGRAAQTPLTESARGAELIPDDDDQVPDCIGESRVNSFTVSPSTIALGDSTTIAWNITLGPGCNFPVLLSGRTVSRQGSLTLSPPRTTSYVLQLRIPGGGFATLASRTLTVQLPSTVTIDCSAWECAELLVGAVGTPGTTVIVENHVSLDLSGRESIRIAAGVRLAGGRDARNSGPLLFTRTRPRPLFRVAGDDARITGLRIRGAEFGIGEGDDNKAKGISVDSNVRVEIANNEISGWSGSAVAVSDTDGDRLTPFNPGDVSIHDNFIHHNQHEGTHGYGVVVGDGAYVRIDRNVFDFNRHAIAGDGSDGSGYWAYLNLVLKGGGVHRCVLGQCANTHQFDMHGQDNCGFWDIFSDSLYNCGPAGHSMEIRYNAFQYRKDNAFKLRGTPAVSPTGAVVAYNVFAHGDLDDAITQTEDGLYPFGNLTGIDTFGEYGVCDFDGDGRDDLFLATGQSWWYSSAARSHWAFLNKSATRLQEVALGYFDDDDRCDVFTRSGNEWRISSGGTGQWTRIETSSVPFAELRFGDFNGDGRTDVFRANGSQWFFAAPGIHGWRALATSSARVGALRLGHFDGDQVTDVLAIVGGQWAVSWGGVTSWQPINARLSSALASFVIADVEGDGIDDVLLYDSGAGRWRLSRDGRGGWETLDIARSIGHFNFGTLFWGRFDAGPGADALVIDLERRGRLASGGQGPFVTFSRYAY
jgi:hypothetical protein